MTLQELIAQRDALNEQIRKYDDGFIYILLISSWGSKSMAVIRNIEKAKEIADRYDGDAGICRGFTNNPNAVQFTYNAKLTGTEPEWLVRTWEVN